MEYLKGLEVSSIQSEPIFVLPLNPVSKVIGVLKEHDAYEALVMIGKKVGMVTSRDLLNVRNITTRKTETLVKFVPSLTPTDSVNKAARIMMQHRIRSIPIVERNKVTGMVTAIVILRQMQNASIGGLKIRSLMTQHPVTVESEDSLAKARNLMVRKKFDHLPVLNSGKLCGLVTSTHILYNLTPSEAVQSGAWGAESRRRLETPVKDLMDPHPFTCEVDDNISTVLTAMLNRNVTCSIIKRWEETHGIVTYRDFVKMVAELPETDETPLYIIGLPDDPFEAEVAKLKLTRIVRLLKRSFPTILEVRSTVKTHESKRGKERRRYEVDVAVKTPKRAFSYHEVGWELPQIYDLISNRIKKLVTRGTKRVRRKPSPRYIES
jgi:CBS domain-containing protein